jgi:hypothetical protein
MMGQSQLFNQANNTSLRRGNPHTAEFANGRHSRRPRRQEAPSDSAASFKNLDSEVPAYSYRPPQNLKSARIREKQAPAGVDP